MQEQTTDIRYTDAGADVVTMTLYKLRDVSESMGGASDDGICPEPPLRHRRIFARKICSKRRNPQRQNVGYHAGPVSRPRGHSPPGDDDTAPVGRTRLLASRGGSR